MIKLSICLSDLQKSAITTSEKNGKKYISLVVDSRKEADKFGNTHTVYVSQTKEEREQKTDKCYVGNGKEYVFEQNKQNKPSPVIEDLPGQEDDLPF